VAENAQLQGTIIPAFISALDGASSRILDALASQLEDVPAETATPTADAVVQAVREVLARGPLVPLTERGAARRADARVGPADGSGTTKVGKGDRLSCS